MIKELKNEIYYVKIFPSGIFYSYDLGRQLEILKDKMNEIIRAINELEDKRN